MAGGEAGGWWRKSGAIAGAGALRKSQEWECFFSAFRQGRFPFKDSRRLGGHFGIERDKVLPLFRNVILLVNRIDRALRLASVAVDAFVGGDIEHLLTLVEAIARANDDAIGIFAAETGGGNDVGHLGFLLSGKQLGCL